MKKALVLALLVLVQAQGAWGERVPQSETPAAVAADLNTTLPTEEAFQVGLGPYVVFIAVVVGGAYAVWRFVFLKPPKKKPHLKPKKKKWGKR